MLAWSTLRDEINGIMGQPTSNGRWSDSVLLARANLVIERAVSSTFCLDSVRSIDASADTLEYSFLTTGSVTLDVREVRRYGKPLEKITIEKLSHLAKTGMIDKNWRGTSSHAGAEGWYRRADKIGIFPKPIKDEPGALEILEWCLPTPLTADASTPFDGMTYLNGYVDLIIFGVVEWNFDELDESHSGEREKWGGKHLARLADLKRFADIRNGVMIQPDPEKLRATGVQKPVLVGGAPSTLQG